MVAGPEQCQLFSEERVAVAIVIQMWFEILADSFLHNQG